MLYLLDSAAAGVAFQLNKTRNGGEEVEDCRTHVPVLSDCHLAGYYQRLHVRLNHFKATWTH